MSSHLCHEDLPGYSEAQILHDGCPECEAREARVVPLFTEEECR